MSQLTRLITGQPDMPLFTKDKARCAASADDENSEQLTRYHWRWHYHRRTGGSASNPSDDGLMDIENAKNSSKVPRDAIPVSISRLLAAPVRPAIARAVLFICLSGALAGNAAWAADAQQTVAEQAGAPLPLAGKPGMAIAEYWSATPAEYQATAEAILDAVGASNLRRADLAGAIAAQLLLMFGGGAGAPQDLIRRQAPAKVANDE